jgi:hypothetical protein
MRAHTFGSILSGTAAPLARLEGAVILKTAD